MHPLHDKIAALLASDLRERGIVVIWDSDRRLVDFFVEAAGCSDLAGRLAAITLNGAPAQLFTLDGSRLQARVALEPLVGGDRPEPVVLYAPGETRGDEKLSLLMELEKAGRLYIDFDLERYARDVLRARFDDASIDEMLRPGLSWSDLTGLCRPEDGGGSLLRTVFDTADPIGILAEWLAVDSTDAQLAAKSAWAELKRLAQNRVGLELQDPADGPRWRAATARYVLGHEFRCDLSPDAALTAPPKAALAALPRLPGDAELRAVRGLAARLRERWAEAYVALAERVQAELRLDEDCAPGGALGRGDTFGFEEKAAAREAVKLVAAGRIDAASALIAGRTEGFWVARDPAREMLWQVCRLMIDVCAAAERVRRDLERGVAENASDWIERYASSGEDAWFRLDLAQRHFETLLPAVEDEFDPVAVAAVRGSYEDAVRRMSEGFVKALERSDWSAPGVLHQTRIWPDVVTGRARPVAYVFVDAMRYEMGHELAGRLEAAAEVQLRPAVAALPSITPVGMAALLPGAASSFSVVEQGGRLGALIDGVFLPDRAARRAFLEGRVPGVVSIELDALASMNAQKLKSTIGAASVVAVHSTDIDGAGEHPISTTHARRIMDGVISDLNLALRKLAAVGVEDAVVTADHGHFFFAGERPGAMRMDAPGGQTVDVHRRCWVGRGGSTPPGAVRAPAAKLGYATDLEFAFPVSTAVFKSGGDLAYHHGGPSLQEMIVPVLAVKAKRRVSAPSGASGLKVSYEFQAITNRIFTIQLELDRGGLFAGKAAVRPLVVSGEREVGRAALAPGAQFENGRLTLEPGSRVTVGFMLADDSAASVRIRVLDADTDAVLYESAQDLAVKLGV